MKKVYNNGVLTHTLITVNDLYDLKINANGSEEATTYYRANNEMIAKKVGTTITYHHNDHLNSASIVTNTTGAIEEETRYYPYGSVRSGGSESKTGRYTYTDQESDNETGLMYYGARYYNASIGRFVQPDSMLPDMYDPQEINRYAYVKNNPLKYTDPTGHCATGIVIDTGVCGVVVVIGGASYTVAVVGITTITVGGVIYGVSCIINCDATNENIGNAVIKVEQINNKIGTIAKVAYYQAQNAVSNSVETIKKGILGLVAVVLTGQAGDPDDEEGNSKNYKIDNGKQSKHIKGSNNYQAGKSEFTHKNPQKLLDKFSGKGQKVTPDKSYGEAGYKERVDFGETIGTYVDTATGKSYSTTKGIINYDAKGGAHIVPVRP